MEAPTDRLRRHADEYRSDTTEDRPIGAYTGLMAIYLGAVAALSLVGRRRLPGALGPSDLLLGSVATFTLTRTIAKDPIASPLRMPFTRFEGASGASELQEEVRATGWRHAVGELLTCPFCLSQWTATLLVAGIVVVPRFTRTMMSVLTMVGASDALQLVYGRAKVLAQG